jgi:PII-like signaling protein
MEIKGEAKLLRIFISSTDKYKHQPLYEVVVFKAKEHGIAGATVLKGVMGYGASNTIYSPSYWEVAEKVPLLIEIVDESEKIEKFIEIIMPIFDNLNKGCMITVEKANIILHKKGTKKKE